MEQNKQIGGINFKFTNRDKIYLCIISVLLVTIIILAIVLPRPYKTVEVEKPVDNYIYQKVYDTKKVYIISTESALYDEVNHNYIDTDDNVYTILQRFTLLDTGAFKNMSVTVYIDTGESTSTYKRQLTEDLSAEFVKDVGNGAFGIDVFVTSENMKTVATTLRQDISALGYGQSYLLNIQFENAVLNYIVTYVE